MNRVPVGDGEFPIMRILQTLDQIGGLTGQTQFLPLD